MPTGWDVYYVVFLSAIVALGLPASLKFVSFWVSRKTASGPAPSQGGILPKQGQTTLGQRVNARFFLAANAALVLITLTLTLIPLASTLQPQNSGGVMWGLISIVSIALFSGLGLLYSARKGDLSWMSSYEADRTKGKQS